MCKFSLLLLLRGYETLFLCCQNDVLVSEFQLVSTLSAFSDSHLLICSYVLLSGQRKAYTAFWCRINLHINLPSLAITLVDYVSLWCAVVCLRSCVLD